MLKMEEVHNIRNLFYEQGMNITEIRRETGKDRKTIRYYLNKSDWNQEQSQLKNPASFPKLEPYKAEIDAWLAEDKKAKRKQRHTAKRVYDRLVEKHKHLFACSYRTVASYVAIRKKEIFGKKPGHLPLEHIPGEAQADFGEAEYYENGKLYCGKYLNLSFPFSNKGYFQLFKGENQECLFEGLLAIFQHIKGVPVRIWFDNTSTIVTKVLKHGERNLTDAFLRFAEHYRFEATFCNANAGHEKGSVEGKVGYHRRNMLVPVPRFTKLADFNQELLQKCDLDALREHYRKNATIEELFALDRREFLPLPDIRLDVAKYITVKTNDYGRFCLNNGLHEYSVSPKYANSRVLVKITANEVMPLDESYREIVRHERFYGEEKQQSMKWLPYLSQLSRCPAALKYSGIYRMLPLSVQSYLDNCDKSARGQALKMINTLTEMSGFASAVETIENALRYERMDIDSLLNLHKRIHGVVTQLPPLKLAANIPVLEPVHADLTAYDKNLTEELEALR